MNDQTTKLLETLAQKLGTTSQYLWSILLKQAPIDATINLMYFVFILLYGFILYRVHRYLLVKRGDGNYKESLYSEYEEGLAVPMLLGALIFVFLFVFAFCSMGDIINGYFNPEYWALNKIFSSLKE